MTRAGRASKQYSLSSRYCLQSLFRRGGLLVWDKVMSFGLGKMLSFSVLLSLDARVPVQLPKALSPTAGWCDAPWKVLLGSAAVGLLSAGYSPGLKHIPGLSPYLGTVQPSLQAPLLVFFSSFAFASPWQHFHFCPHFASTVIF